MATYNSFDAWAQEFQKTLEQSKEQLALVAAKNAEAELKRRVFNDGQDMYGRRIGSYSTKEAYFPIEAFIKRSVFESNTRYGKTMYFPDGYKGLRELNGRQTDYVDLNYSGSLMNSIRTEKRPNGYAVVISNDDAAIAEKQEKRFKKKIFKAGNREITSMLDSVRDELNFILRRQ